MVPGRGRRYGGKGGILAAIVVAAVALWVTLGQRLAEKLATVVGSF